MNCLIFSILLIFPTFLFADDSKSVRELTEFSRRNLKGHVALYNDGWKLITSTKTSLDYAKKHSIDTARDAFLKWAVSISKDSKKWALANKEIPSESIELFKKIEKWGRESRKEIWSLTDKVVQQQIDVTKNSFVKAVELVSLGTIYANKLTQDDREKMAKLVKGFPSQVVKDFKDMKSFVKKLKGKKKDKIEKSWKQAFGKASSEWNKEYEKSGKERNSLTALPFVIWGGIKSVWYGIFKPSSENLADGVVYVGKKSFKLVEKLVLLPIASGLLVTGRTVWTLGGVTYYTAKSGVKIISTTVQGGILGAMSLASAASIAPTYVSGKSLGFLTQSALTATGVGTAAGYAAGKEGVATTALTAKFLYNTTLETSKVLIGNTMSGIVLGYNALSALPVQAALGTLNGVGFLVWDGPRLAYYFARGKIKGEDVQNLPVGTVIDVKKLKKEGVEVEEVPLSDEEMENLLNEVPKDLGNNEN